MKASFSSLCAAALGLLALAPGSVLAAKPSTGCGKASKLVTGSSTTQLTFTSGGKARTYYVNLPANYNNTHPYRFIYTLHALGGTAAQVISGTGGYVPWYGLPALISDTTSAIYVAPNGESNGWANTGGSDATFLTDLLHALEADLCVDLNLVFSTGFSYGAAMSYSLACSLGSELRAVAVLSGNPQISGCAGNASQPVAYYGEHGVSDQVLPITGGRQMRDRFVKNNGCTAETPAEPAAGSGTHIKTQYKGCDKYPVTWVAFDGPHTPQPMDKGQSKSFAPNETYEFFMQFT